MQLVRILFISHIDLVSLITDYETIFKHVVKILKKQLNESVILVKILFSRSLLMLD